MEDVELETKTVIVTGSNTGIGRETARELARKGARVILACRNREKAELARDDIINSTGNTDVVIKVIDLASLDSIKQFAEDINKNEERVDLLVNNAAILTKTRKETEDGFEMMFGTNHLGHFYLTYLLLDKLKASAPSRIVNVSSKFHRLSKLNIADLQTARGFSMFKVYGKTKTANILFSVHLAKILRGTAVTVYSLHPGIVKTEIDRELGKRSCMSCFNSFLICLSCQKTLTPAEGAMTSLYCCLEPSIAEDSGKFYEDCKEKVASSHATDEDLAQKLWDVSLELCRLTT